MRVIHKFNVRERGYTHVQLPCDAEVLTFQQQRGQLFIWVSLDPIGPTSPFLFRSMATGEQYLPEIAGRYIGTAQNGGAVTHLFLEERPL